MLEAPGGLIAVTAECRNGKAERVQFKKCRPSPTSWTRRSRLKAWVHSKSTLPMAATASPSSTRRRSASRFGPTKRVDCGNGRPHIAAANEQLGFSHPETGGWDHISSASSPGRSLARGTKLQGSNACVIRPGKIDRSPTGTGCSARMATLSTRGLMAEGNIYRARSIIGSESSAASRAGPRSGLGRPLFRLFRAGPGLPASASICSTWPIRGLRATGSGYLAAFKGGNLSVFTVHGRSVDAKTAMKYPLHGLLSSHKPDFKNFVRGLA